MTDEDRAIFERMPLSQHFEYLAADAIDGMRAREVLTRQSSNVVRVAIEVHHACDSQRVLA